MTTYLPSSSGMVFNTSGTYYPMTVTTAGNTSDTIAWNGTHITVLPTPVREPAPEKPTDWLRRRVDEVRVDLMAEAA